MIKPFACLDLLRNGLMFSSDLVWAFGDRMVLIFRCVFVNGIPVEDIDVFLIPEVPVAEYNSGCDDCEGEDNAGEGDVHLCLPRLCPLLPSLVGLWV